MHKTEVVQLYLNATMTKIFKIYCNARIYYWNLGLEVWNSMYEKYLKTGENRPNEYAVRNYLVSHKSEWEKNIPSRVMRYAISDLAEAWNHFLRKDTKDWGKPHFKRKKDINKFGFKLENIKIENNKLWLTKPKGFKGEWYPIRFRGSKHIKTSSDIVADVSFFTENGKYYAALTYVADDVKSVPLTNEENGIDLNVGKFTDINGDFNILPKKLLNYYKMIAFYQRRLAKKRIKNKEYFKSNTYKKTRTKLNRLYKRIKNIQYDMVKKYINNQIKTYKSITIEDLNIKGMKMGIASKGLHRSLFGFFRQWIEYKSSETTGELVIADRLYPSTQRCPICGHIKTGIEKITLHGNLHHGTKHNEYICYECGYENDRDKNAVMNLISYKYSNWSRVAAQG